MRIAIIGLGLIGGSMAIDLRKRGFASHIIGVDTDNLHAQTAKKIGFVDELTNMKDAIKSTDMVILATPADVTLYLLPKILDLVDEQIVADVCSTKESILESVKNHKNRKNFLSTHPMAGTEYSGPWAALSGLFDGKAVIFTDMEDSGEKAIFRVRKMYEVLSMRPLQMSARDHDIHVAYVSHISHISSFALALTVLEKERDERNIFNLASGGFDSTVRLAKSSAEMWAPIFEQNSTNVIKVVETYIDKLRSFKTAIEDGNPSAVRKLILEANGIRKVLVREP